MTDAYLKPRLCHLLKWPDFNGYGFNLHAEKGKAGQYIGKVDEGSPAEAAGLKDGDRIVEVNGTNIGNENHQQVVSRIKAGGEQTNLLVVDKETDQHYKDEKKVVRGDLPEVVVLRCPSHDPEPPQEDVPPSYNDVTEEPAVSVTQVETVQSAVSNTTTSSQFTPRLCHMKKRPDFNGYGFNLHAERDKPGQYIGKIDDDSPALAADLREGDRIVEVNGTNIESESHQRVIELVKSGGDETRMLVVDKATDEYYKSQGVTVSSSMSEVRRISSVKEEEQVSAVVETPPPVFNIPPPPTELPPPEEEEDDDFNVDELRDLGNQEEAVEETVEAVQSAEVEAEVPAPEDLPPPQDEVVENDQQIEEQISAEVAETAESAVVSEEISTAVVTEEITDRLAEITQNSEEVTENAEEVADEVAERAEEVTENAEEIVQNEVEATQVAEVADEVQAAVEDNNVSEVIENVESSAVNGQTTITETVTSYTAPEPTPAPVPVSQPDPAPAPKQANGSADPIFGMSAAEMKERLKSRKKVDPRSTNVGFVEKHKLFERM